MLYVHRNHIRLIRDGRGGARGILTLQSRTYKHCPVSPPIGVHDDMARVAAYLNAKIIPQLPGVWYARQETGCLLKISPRLYHRNGTGR